MHMAATEELEQTKRLYIQIPSNILYLLGAEFWSYYGDKGGTVFTINKCDYDSYIETKNLVNSFKENHYYLSIMVNPIWKIARKQKLRWRS